MKYLNRIFFYALVFVTTLTFSLSAQNAKHKSNIALNGYCPVAYHVLKKAMKGNPKYSLTYEGKTYHFVNAKAKMMFQKDPAKFLPEYGGFGAEAMSMGKKIKANPKLFILYKGHTYLFSGKKAKAMFEKDPAKHIAEANKVYAADKK